MGRNRSGTGNSRPKFKDIPMCWLSAPIPTRVVKVPSKDTVKFIICKTPLPNSFTNLLSAKDNWSVEKAVEKAKSLVPDCVKVVAVNASSCNEVITETMWNQSDVELLRVCMKDYESSHVDAFCEFVDQTTGSGPTAVIVYTGKGTNRAPYLVSGYLARNGMSIQDAVDACIDAYPDCIFKEKALKALEELSKEIIDVKLEKPRWYKVAEPVQIGDVDLELVQRSRSLEKVSRKYSSGKYTVSSGSEYDEVLDLVQSVTKNWEVVVNGIPKFKSEIYNTDMLDEIEKEPHYCTFEPRGFRSFIVATSKDDVYYLDEYNELWKLKATTTSKVPAVALATTVIDKRKCMVFLTDCLIYGKNNAYDMRLSLRLSYCYKMSLDLKVSDTEDLTFLFRPVSEMRNITELQKDLPELICKCDGLGIYTELAPAGMNRFIPLRPTFQIQVNMNTHKKAILIAKNGPGDDDLAPVGVMSIADEKFAGLDLRTSRIRYSPNKSEPWQPVEIGMHDAPDDLDYVTAVVEFMNKHASDESKNQSVKQILRDLEKIQYD